MFEENDGIVVVDYKSDRFVSEEQLRHRYEKQLEIYKAAIELTTGKNVKKLIIYSIDLEKEIEI
jgi:ATP-dependent helicase/nuclease subunit A